MDKLTFIKLWDIYQVILTPTQREIGNLYFNFDLSLSEIAEQKGITRAGVSECLKAARNAFADIEAKLHILESKEEAKLKGERMKADLENLLNANSIEEMRAGIERFLEREFPKTGE